MGRRLTRKGRVKRADRVFSLFIRQRDKQCVLCGSRDQLQAGHVFSRVAHSTRWEEGNCFAQCARCNYNHEHNPWPFHRWFIQKFGQERLDDLYKLYSRTKRKSDREIDEIYEKYKKLLTQVVPGGTL